MFKELCIKDTPHLRFVRQGLFNPDYELTDGNGLYGVLSYRWFARRQATAYTAAHKWLFDSHLFFSKTISIMDETGAMIGLAEREFFSRIYTLNLKSGFRAIFRRPSIFSRQYIWEAEGYGRLITLENNFPFGLDNDVYIEQTQAPATVIPLLIFLGMHLSVYRRGRRAAR